MCVTAYINVGSGVRGGIGCGCDASSVWLWFISWLGLDMMHSLSGGCVARGET